MILINAARVKQLPRGQIILFDREPVIIGTFLIDALKLWVLRLPIPHQADPFISSQFLIGFALTAHSSVHFIYLQQQRAV